MNILKTKIRKMPDHKNFYWIVSLSILISYSCSGQTNKKNSYKTGKSSVLCCFEHIKEQLAHNHYIQIPKGSKSYVYKNIKIVGNEDTFYILKSDELLKLHSDTSDIDEWSDVIDWDSVMFYTTSSTSDQYLVGISSIYQATGLASNFYKWLIIDLQSGKFFIFWSLSNDPSFFDISKEDLQFYIFDYSEDFLEKRDFNHVSLNITQFKVENGHLIKKDVEIQKCNCW